MDEETNDIDPLKEEMSSECRTCLQTISSDTELYYIFQSWVPPWEGIDYTIAEALEKLAQVQISAIDQYSKMICGKCCQKLYSACIFTTLIQQSDQILRQRHASGLQVDGTAEDNWPKPIKLNVNIPADDQIGVEMKKEVLSDEEDSEYSRVVEGHSDVANMDIKIESVELETQQHSRVAINDDKSQGADMKETLSKPPLKQSHQSEMENVVYDSASETPSIISIQPTIKLSKNIQLLDDTMTLEDSGSESEVTESFLVKPMANSNYLPINLQSNETASLSQTEMNVKILKSVRKSTNFIDMEQPISLENLNINKSELTENLPFSFDPLRELDVDENDDVPENTLREQAGDDGEINKAQPAETKESYQSDFTPTDGSDFNPDEDEEYGSENEFYDDPIIKRTKNKSGNTKRSWTRRNACFYCQQVVTNFTRHLLRHHENEIDVIQYKSIKDDDPKVRKMKRQKISDKIRNKGNFLHNSKVCSDRDGSKTLIPAKRRDVTSSPASFATCKNCLGTFKRSTFFRHFKKCGNISKGRVLTKNSIVIIPNTETVSEELKKEILPHLRADDTALVVKNDRLILAYGTRLLKKKKERRSPKAICSKMRDLATLLILIRKHDSSIETLTDALDPEKYKVFIAAVKEMCGFNEDIGEVRVPSIPDRILPAVLGCVDILSTQSIMSSESTVFKELYQKKLDEFKQLVTKKRRHMRHNSSTGMRHHIATMSQLNAKQNDQYMEHLAGFLGHDIAVHAKNYILPSQILQKAVVGSQLIKYESRQNKSPSQINDTEGQFVVLKEDFEQPIKLNEEAIEKSSEFAKNNTESEEHLEHDTNSKDKSKDNEEKSIEGEEDPGEDNGEDDNIKPKEKKQNNYRKKIKENYEEKPKAQNLVEVQEINYKDDSNNVLEGPIISSLNKTFKKINLLENQKYGNNIQTRFKRKTIDQMETKEKNNIKVTKPKETKLDVPSSSQDLSDESCDIPIQKVTKKHSLEDSDEDIDQMKTKQKYPTKVTKQNKARQNVSSSSEDLNDESCKKSIHKITKKRSLVEVSDEDINPERKKKTKKSELQDSDEEKLIVRRRKETHRFWSDVESKAVKFYFKDYIKNKINPGKAKCLEVLKKAPVLQTRTWMQLNSYVNNIYKNKRKYPF